MQGMGVSALFLGPWQACVILLDSTLSWQACLLNFSSTISWQTCSVNLCVQHPLLKVPLEVTRKTKPGCHSVPGGYRHCQRGWSQPFTGHSGGRTVLLIRGEDMESPSEADDWRQSWEMGWGWKSSRGCQPAFQDLFSHLLTLTEHLV